MKKLYRLRKGKCIAGVCGGIAKYFKIDSRITRLLFVALTLINSKSLIVYIILVIFVPKEPKTY